MTPNEFVMLQMALTKVKEVQEILFFRLSDQIRQTLVDCDPDAEIVEGMTLITLQDALERQVKKSLELIHA